MCPRAELAVGDGFLTWACASERGAASFTSGERLRRRIRGEDRVSPEMWKWRRERHANQGGDLLTKCGPLFRRSACGPGPLTPMFRPPVSEPGIPRRDRPVSALRTRSNFFPRDAAGWRRAPQSRTTVHSGPQQTFGTILTPSGPALSGHPPIATRDRKTAVPPCDDLLHSCRGAGFVGRR